jgi:hypothetical protein
MIAETQISKLLYHYKICIAFTEFRSNPSNPNVKLRVSLGKKDLFQNYNHPNMEEVFLIETENHSRININKLICNQEKFRNACR